MSSWGLPKAKRVPIWRTTVLWTAVCAAVALLALDRAFAAAAEVDARTAHRAVWKIYGAGKSGTAFAIGDRHFLTCAHVIKGFADHGAREVFINRYGDKDSRTLRVNYDHVALTLVQDIALFTTKDTVDHYFALATGNATEGEIELRTMGHPKGLALETLRQTNPIAFQDEFQLTIPSDKVTRGGLSGSPVFRDDGKVVGMHCQGSDNMQIAVKVEHLRRFLDGGLAWTACGDQSSVAACIKRATMQVRELAEAGDLVAQYQLGRDDGHIDKDVAMLRRAAEGGWALAQHSLGSWLRERERWAEAAKWYRRSAEQGEPAAKVGLALLLYRGQGVPRDRVRAFRLMLEVARTGDMIAQYNVGLMYQRGNGTERDTTKARQWFQRSADKGHEGAREKLRSLAASVADGSFRPGSVMRAVTRSNVRAGPGTSYAKVGLLEVGEEVRVIGHTGNWLRLQPTSRQPERFVYGPLLTEMQRPKVAQ